eukprot:IDg11250t1
MCTIELAPYLMCKERYVTVNLANQVLKQPFLFLAIYRAYMNRYDIIEHSTSVRVKAMVFGTILSISPFSKDAMI